MEKELYFAGGCFWGIQKYFSCIHGVKAAQAGYANGRGDHPSYRDVCNGSGHAEVVKVRYDPEKITTEQLVFLFYEVIDPTSVNQQGPDYGIQYRCGIYYSDPSDCPLLEQSAKTLQRQYDQPLALEILPLQNYYPAEQEHQDYLEKNPFTGCHIPSHAFIRARRYRPSPYRRKTRKQLTESLSKLEFDVTQKGATEPPFHNRYFNHYEKGIYVDVTTGEPLFSSSDKFDCGCGWPSFLKPISPDSLVEKDDHSFGMQRTEVRSLIGNAHLGHVFSDGPLEKGGLRYCINSAALLFIPYDKMEELGYKDYLCYVE